MILADSPPSTAAGIVTAVASLFTATALVITALALLIPILKRTKKAEEKLDEVHTIVNQQRTDMMALIALQEQQGRLQAEALRDAGLPPVAGPSK